MFAVAPGPAGRAEIKPWRKMAAEWKKSCNFATIPHEGESGAHETMGRDAPKPGRVTHGVLTYSLTQNRLFGKIQSLELFSWGMQTRPGEQRQKENK